MISDHGIARWRLRSQRLVQPHAADALDVVGNLLAVQAENPAQSAWAVASRTSEPSAAEIRDALDAGRLIRTHVLRPTWHYVLADDIGWLLDLTAPRIRRVTSKQLSATHGLDPRRLDRASSAVIGVLRERADRTRSEIVEALRLRGLELSGQPLMILLAHLELGRVVCSGRPRENEHTYALFDDRVRVPRTLERDEALAELVLRYFSGHGPATERDLAYWATLTLADVRRGLSLVGDRLDSFEHDGKRFFHAPGETPRRRGRPIAHLLQILDEMYRGYQDSRWVLDTAGNTLSERESALGMALVDAQLVAGMRRTITADRVVFRLDPHRELRPRDLTTLRRAADRYGAYLGLDPTLELA